MSHYGSRLHLYAVQLLHYPPPGAPIPVIDMPPEGGPSPPPITPLNVTRLGAPSPPPGAPPSFITPVNPTVAQQG